MSEIETTTARSYVFQQNAQNTSTDEPLDLTMKQHHVENEETHEDREDSSGPPTPPLRVATPPPNVSSFNPLSALTPNGDM